MWVFCLFCGGLFLKFVVVVLFFVVFVWGFVCVCVVVVVGWGEGGVVVTAHCSDTIFGNSRIIAATASHNQYLFCFN